MEMSLLLVARDRSLQQSKKRSLILDLDDVVDARQFQRRFAEHATHSMSE